MFYKENRILLDEVDRTRALTNAPWRQSRQKVAAFPNFEWGIVWPPTWLEFDRVGLNLIKLIAVVPTPAGVQVKRQQHCIQSASIYTTQVNSAFSEIWLVPQSRDIKCYSPPGGFRVKKMSCETHFIRKWSNYLGIAIKLVVYILKQLFASVSVTGGGYLPRRSGSVNIHRYSPPLLRIIVNYSHLAAFGERKWRKSHLIRKEKKYLGIAINLCCIC